MKSQIPASTRLARAFTTAALFSCLSAGSLSAASETWTRTTTGGNWSDLANWASGTGYANGIDAVATLSASGTQTVNLDTNVTLGSIAFSTGTYTVSSSNGSAITLSGTTTPSGPGIPTGLGATPNISGTGTISAVLAGTQGFIFSAGNRSLTLSGNNTYTGQTTLTNGNLNLRSANGLGVSGGAGNGTLVSRGDSGQFPQLHLQNNVSSAEDITLRIGYSSGTAGAITGDNPLIVNDSGSNSTLSGAITLMRATNGGTNNINLFRINNTSTLNLTGNISGVVTGTQATTTYANPNRLMIQSSAATNGTTLSGIISDGTIGNGGVSFYTSATNLGIVRLSGANTYSGSTVHQKGTLLINNGSGSGTGVGAVSVDATATFGGTGTIAPTGSNGVTFASGSFVAPGDVTNAGVAVDAGESLTFNLSGTTGAVAFTGATLSFNLNAGPSSTLVESLEFIGLTADSADVVFSGNSVNFSIVGTLADGLYTLASFDAANAYTKNQWTIGTGLESYLLKELVYNANSIQLQIGAIPEPSSFAAIGGLMALGFAATGRRRRQ